MPGQVEVQFAERGLSDLIKDFDRLDRAQQKQLVKLAGIDKGLQKTARGAVKIGIDAPAEVRVMRGELVEQKPAAGVPESCSAVNVAPAGMLSDQFPHVA